jgi:hypothetical protein
MEMRVLPPEELIETALLAARSRVQYKDFHSNAVFQRAEQISPSSRSIVLQAITTFLAENANLRPYRCGLPVFVAMDRADQT